MNLEKIRQLIISGDMSIHVLRYLIECKCECEHLDFKLKFIKKNDYFTASIGRDAVAMRNSGGGYIVFGVNDKTWDPEGLVEKLKIDTKQLRDLIRKATGLDLEADIVHHSLFLNGSNRIFSLILIRSTSKRNKLRSPSICSKNFHSKESWGISAGDIFFRKGDQTIKVTTEREHEVLLEDLQNRQDLSAHEQSKRLPTPFEIENGLYRLLPREYDKFIGRSELKTKVRTAIERDPRIWIVNLFGPGGVGKSALASWVSYEYYTEKRFEAILQLSAKNTQLTSKGILKLTPSLISLENLFDNILHLFGFSDYVQENEQQRQYLVTQLLSDYKTLLVLDNMETVQDGRIMNYVRNLPPDTKTKVLLTSRIRSRSWEEPIQVNELSEIEIQEFVEIKSKEMSIWPLPDTEQSNKKIREASGGLPLAIQWMLGEYVITHDWVKVLNRVKDTDSPLLEFSFRNAWKVLSDKAKEALAVLSIFDEPPTSNLWATALGWSIEDIDESVTNLEEATFISKKIDIKTGKETFHSLPITLEFARNDLAQRGDLETRTRINYQKYIQQMDLVSAEIDGYSSLFKNFNVERNTEKKAIIIARKAESEVSSLNYSEADRLFQRALKIDPRSIYVLVNFANLKLELGHIGEAIALMERAVKRCNKYSGFYVYFNFGRIYDEIRDRDKVEYCLRKALEFEPDHPIALHQFGVVLSRLGKYREALEVFDKLISNELSRPHGPTDTLIYTYKTKIITYKKSGRDNLAKTTLREATNEIKKHPQLALKVYELSELFDEVV